MKIVSTPLAPEPAGHYSQAVVHEGMVYISGQGPREPGDVGGCPRTIETQTILVLTNIGALLRAAGSSPDRVLKVTIYLTDMNLWATVNQLYGAFFGVHRPARTVIPVPELRHGYLLEIDAVAAVSSPRI